MLASLERKGHMLKPRQIVAAIQFQKMREAAPYVRARSCSGARFRPQRIRVSDKTVCTGCKGKKSSHACKKKVQALFVQVMTSDKTSRFMLKKFRRNVACECACRKK